MLVISINLIITRYVNQIHHGITNLFVYLWGIIQGVILALAFGVFVIPEVQDILGLMLSGLCLSLGMAFIVLALQEEEAGIVALIRTSELIFVFFWQWILLGTLPDMIRFVISCNVIISLNLYALLCLFYFSGKVTLIWLNNRLEKVFKMNWKQPEQ